MHVQLSWRHKSQQNYQRMAGNRTRDATPDDEWNSSLYYATYVNSIAPITFSSSFLLILPDNSVASFFPSRVSCRPAFDEIPTFGISRNYNAISNDPQRGRVFSFILIPPLHQPTFIPGFFVSIFSIPSSHLLLLLSKIFPNRFFSGTEERSGRYFHITRKVSIFYGHLSVRLTNLASSLRTTISRPGGESDSD